MIAVFYSKIRPADGQTEIEVIKKAHILGYELVPFDGFDNQDLSGACKKMARLNLNRILEIQDSCVKNFPNGQDWPQIFHTIIMAEKE